MLEIECDGFNVLLFVVDLEYSGRALKVNHILEAFIAMKRSIISLGFLALAVVLTACNSGTPEQQIKRQESLVKVLTPEENALAAANAKAYFEQMWPTNEGKDKKGKFINCRPTDSNANGLVSCSGYVVDTDGVLQTATVYGRYFGQGVSDQDTVK